MNALSKVLEMAKHTYIADDNDLLAQAAAELAQLCAGYVEIFALAIMGRADAVIVDNQEFDARHVILQVKNLAEEHRKLRAELDSKNKIIERLTDELEKAGEG